MEEQPKPKRVLTEAQRLAFLKGREKRMANIEKKRLEKLEMEEIIKSPEPKVVTPDKGVDENKENKPPPAATQLNHDELAEKIASKIIGKIPPPPPLKRKYERKPKVQKNEIPEVAPPVEPIKNVLKFSWL